MLIILFTCQDDPPTVEVLDVPPAVAVVVVVAPPIQTGLLDMETAPLIGGRPAVCLWCDFLVRAVHTDLITVADRLMI